MWRYGIGKEPQRKKSKTDDEKTVRKTAYEAERRTRAFRLQWTQTFSWLQYDSEEEKMFCSECRVSPLGDSQSAFVSGSKNFKIDPIKAHDVSAYHVRVIEKKKASNEAAGSSLASKALSSLQSAQVQRLQKLFQTAHALVKHSRPFTDFSWQCKLDIKKGIDIGQTYHNDKACKEFAKCISEAALQKLVCEIQKAKCFSITCDESTDSAVLEDLIIYVGFCNKGKLSAKLLCVTPLNKPDAQSIYSAIKEACTNHLKLINPFEKLICFTADGAATMQGSKKGVGQKLAQQQPHLIKLHCMAHRLELAFKGTVTAFEDYKKVDQFLLTIYLFYHNSASNRSQLKEACTTLAVKPLVPTRVGGTRWLPHLSRAFSNFWNIYEALIVQLENCTIVSKTDSSLKASGILKLMKSKPFIHSALELNSAVTCLQKVCLVLQNRVTTLFQAQQSISAAIEVLSDLKIDRSVDHKINNPPFKDRLEDTTRSRGQSNASAVKIFPQFLDSLITQLKIRFPSEQYEALVLSTKLLSFIEWPVACNAEFGKPELRQLVENHFLLLDSLGVDTSSIQIDWIKFRNSLYASNTDIKHLTWEIVNSEHHVGHENILQLFDILLTIPCTSTECERGFSRMKHLKTDLRSSIGAQTLTDLMCVALDTPNVDDFDPTDAISLWLESGKYRKLDTKPYGQRNNDSCDSDDNNEL